jgi:hypothetical protein
MFKFFLEKIVFAKKWKKLLLTMTWYGPLSMPISRTPLLRFEESTDGPFNWYIEIWVLKKSFS